MPRIFTEDQWRDFCWNLALLCLSTFILGIGAGFWVAGSP